MKKILFIAKFCLLLIFCLWFSDCKKSNNHVNIILYDKPLSVIQSYIQGKWRLHYTVGGICGSCKYDREPYNEYYEFSSNNKIIYTYRDSILVDTSFKWIIYQSPNAGNYIHNILEYYDKKSVLFHFEVDKVVNDTLVLAQPFLNNPDYMLYFFTKIK